jgi:protein phosphatase 1L
VVKEYPMLYIIPFSVLFLTCFAAEQPCFTWGSSARKGDRSTMEDRTMNINPLHNEQSKGLFGIFDGHGGYRTAEYAANNFETYYNLFGSNQEPDFTSIFKQLNKGIYVTDECYNSGTCALVGLINKYYYNLAWVGDSRAVYMSDGQELFETIDHKLTTKKERTRIINSNGILSERKLPSGNVYERCCGLVISRALGNEVLSEQYTSFFTGSILHTPDMCEGVAKPGDVLIFACDGVWDVFKSEEACEFVQKVLTYSQADLEKQYPEIACNRTTLPDPITEEKGDDHLKLVARALRDESYIKGSGDNLSVQIIQFQ